MAIYGIQNIYNIKNQLMSTILASLKQTLLLAQSKNHEQKADASFNTIRKPGENTQFMQHKIARQIIHFISKSM